MPTIPMIVPEETTLLEAAEQAVAAGLHLICNGKRTVISPTIPAGWFKIAVKHKTQATPCHTTAC